MSNVFTSAGTKLHIASTATAPATYDGTGYAALTWVEVGEITDLGSFGKEYAQVTHTSLGNRQTVKRKGSYNNGSMALQLGRDTSDAGQAILIVAVDSDDSYPVKVTLQDDTVIYTTAQVMSYTTNIGSPDSIVGASVTLEIDRAIIEV